jgi:predicted CXXCH cytochrome family protein
MRYSCSIYNRGFIIKSNIRLFFLIGLFGLSVFSGGKGFSQTVTTLASTNNPAVPAANICPGTLKVPIYQFTLTTSGALNFTGLNFTTNAGHLATDVIKYQLWSSATNALGGATQVGVDLTASTGPGLHTFAAFTRSVNTTTRYFWITTDVSASPVNSNAITVAALTTANITVSAGTKAGSASIGGAQTLNAAGTVIVSGGGTFCGSATLTASGGTGGTIYWQNTTSNGTSTATPSTSQVVAASGTYYFRAASAGCWGTQGSAAVTISTANTITLGSDPTICRGLTSANLTYSATTGTPNQYSIVYSNAATAQGFVNVTNAALPASPIVLVVPAAASAATYSFDLTVRNSTTGCVSGTYAKTIILNDVPAAPAITGLASQPPSTTGLNYSTASISGVTSYTWTVTTGWSITGGQGTLAIVVTSGAFGQDGNITLTAGNICGTSSAFSRAVSIAFPTPHGTVCDQCHITHTAAGGQLTSIAGNANLCISCHNPVGSASLKPFANSDKAIPGTSGTSHAWDKNAVNATYQTNTPTDAAMLARINSGQIICSTCHNQHSQTYYPYLRADNTGDAMCKDCHSERNLGTYLTNTVTNKSTHPVGVSYNAADPRFIATPVSPVQLVGSKVECSSCHKAHFAGSSDGNILRMTNNELLCQNCHALKTANSTMEHKGMTCVTCHDAHEKGSTNIYLVRTTIATPNSGSKAVSFTADAGPGNFADATAPFNGVCEVCHTLTDHYTNTAGGTSDARHVPATQKCITCHPHNKGFAAQTDCFGCHNAIADKPSVPGTRRQIVDNLGNGTGTGGDFKKTSHHFTGTIPTVDDCVKCHYMGDHKSGTVKLLDPDQGFQTVYSYDPLNKSGIESFCLNCHDADGSNGDVTPFSDNVTVPVIDQALWTASSHKTTGTAKANTCLACHDNGHGSAKSTLLAVLPNQNAATLADPDVEEEEFCLTCHGGGAGGIASKKVHLAFSAYTNTNNAGTQTGTITRYFKHDPTKSYRKHVNGETGGAAFAAGGTQRHVECVDCHNPHGAVAGTATAPTLLPTLTGATGVEPTYTGIGAPTGFTWMRPVTQEYQVCFKCHSSYTTLPTYLPDGISNQTIVADGLKKLTTTANGQTPDSRDMALQYNPNAASFHPVMAAGKNLNILAAAFRNGWTFSSRMYCTDCHNNPLATTAGHGNGPHGSSNLHLLDKGNAGTAQYNTVHADMGSNPNEVCSKCHAGPTNGSPSRFTKHAYHASPGATGLAECYACHDSHGSEAFHLINFNRNGTGGCFTSVTTTTTNAFIHADGTVKNSCVTTCHGVGHSTTGKFYSPAY